MRGDCETDGRRKLFSAITGGAWVATAGMLHICPTRYGKKWWCESAKLYNLIFFGVPVGKCRSLGLLLILLILN